MPDLPVTLVAGVLTPLLTALGTLFWLVVREKDARLEDYRKRVEDLEGKFAPALEDQEKALTALQNSIGRLTDLYERSETRKER